MNKKYKGEDMLSVLYNGGLIEVESKYEVSSFGGEETRFLRRESNKSVNSER